MGMFKEKRSEPRTVKDKYYSVEFSIAEKAFVYQFKIWDISKKGMCILVKEDSAILTHMQIGDVLDMRYYTPGSSKPTDYLKTEIKHVTKNDKGRFKGHCLVGISLLEDM